MTNAIEQTRREMYGFFNNMKGRIMINYSVKDITDGINEFESALEAHLEELRKGMVACNESTVKCARASAESFRALEESNIELSARCIGLTEERDTLRNKLQALQMASSTAAEVIRGLRSELEEARDSMPSSFVPEGQCKVNEDHYSLGFESGGMKSCPYPINTIERLHWMDGARDKMNFLGQSLGMTK